MIDWREGDVSLDPQDGGLPFRVPRTLSALPPEELRKLVKTVYERGYRHGLKLAVGDAHRWSPSYKVAQRENRSTVCIFCGAEAIFAANRMIMHREHGEKEWHDIDRVPPCSRVLPPTDTA